MTAGVVERFLDWMWPPLPVIKALPDHVRNVGLDTDLLWLSMSNAERINPAVHVGGHAKPKEGK